jgi:hypothetical protein
LPFASQVDAIQVHHDLRLLLEPNKNLHHGNDSITLRPGSKAGLVLFLNREAISVQILMDGQPVPLKERSHRSGT